MYVHILYLCNHTQIFVLYIHIHIHDTHPQQSYSLDTCFLLVCISNASKKWLLMGYVVFTVRRRAVTFERRPPRRKVGIAKRPMQGTGRQKWHSCLGERSRERPEGGHGHAPILTDPRIHSPRFAEQSWGLERTKNLLRHLASSTRAL